jgi:hypothetical protein
MELPRALVDTWGHERQWLDDLPRIVDGWLDQHVEEARRILTAR